MTTSIREPCDENVVVAGRAIAPCHRSSAKWVLAATILGSSMAFIDGTVVNVALPALQRSLGASLADVQWVVEAYLLFLSALLLVGGSLGDHYGRRRVFIVGVSVFAAASAWCGCASDIRHLVIGRAAQGFGAALLVPGSLAIISSAFSEEERGRAIGTWSGFSAITAAIGPVLGGWLIDHVSWRAVFFINIPLAIVIITISVWRVPESSSNHKAPLDWAGALLAATSLGLLVFGLIESSSRGFGDRSVGVSLVFSALSFVAFVVLELRTREPMLPFSLFRSRIFSAANLLTLFLYSALGGTLFFLPMNLIQIQQYGPTAAGAALLPLILIIFLLSRWSGGLVHRHGTRPPLVIGPLIAAAGFVLLARPAVGGTYWSTFFPGIVVLGVGMAVSVAPLTTAVMNAVAQERVGIASGVNNAVARVAGLLAIAVLGIVMVHSFNRGLDGRLSHLNLSAAAQTAVNAERSKLGAADVMVVSGEARDAVRQSINMSFIEAFRYLMFIGAGLAVGSAITAATLMGGESAPFENHNMPSRRVTAN